MIYKTVEWICCQYGAREDYAISRSLKENRIPSILLTDFWFPNVLLNQSGITEIRKRYHPGLNHVFVKAFNSYMISARVINRLKRGSIGSLEKIFERKAAGWISRNLKINSPRVAFSYSYAALEIFEACKKMGCITILGQINPGPEEARIVEEAFKAEFGNQYPAPVPSPEYWQNWWKEVNLADRIVANSAWSESMLIKAGVAREKLRVIPLAFERQQRLKIKKTYPEKFSDQRPLKLLFLGSVSVRKGFHFLKKAMADLIHAPVILDVAGSVIGPEELLENLPPNINFHGRKNFREKDTFYRNADAFILPTLSDGFAITQLEAQYWNLPIIVSKRCGEIVKQGHNGILLEDADKESIVKAILFAIDHPDKLEIFSGNSIDLSSYSLRSIGEKWINSAG